MKSVLGIIGMAGKRRRKFTYNFTVLAVTTDYFFCSILWLSWINYLEYCWFWTCEKNLQVYWIERYYTCSKYTWHLINDKDYIFLLLKLIMIIVVCIRLKKVVYAYYVVNYIWSFIELMFFKIWTQLLL